MRKVTKHIISFLAAIAVLGFSSVPSLDALLQQLVSHGHDHGFVHTAHHVGHESEHRHHDADSRSDSHSHGSQSISLLASSPSLKIVTSSSVPVWHFATAILLALSLASAAGLTRPVRFERSIGPPDRIDLFNSSFTRAPPFAA